MLQTNFENCLDEESVCLVRKEDEVFNIQRLTSDVHIDAKQLLPLD